MGRWRWRGGKEERGGDAETGGGEGETGREQRLVS